MIEINSNSLKDTKFSVADILDSYTSKLAQGKDVSINMSVEEYITIISALKYAISYLRRANNGK
jgi:hypothetical protein